MVKVHFYRARKNSRAEAAGGAVEWNQEEWNEMELNDSGSVFCVDIDIMLGGIGRVAKSGECSERLRVPFSP